jgi:hypothetical protein
MQFTFWTLAADCDEGLITDAFLTRDDALAAREGLLRIDWERWGEGEFPGADEAHDKLSGTVGYMDSYSITSHRLEIPEAVTLPDWVAGLVNRMATVEGVLRKIVEGKREMITADEARELANKLSVPVEVQTASTRVAFELEVKHTARGFPIIEFQDRYDRKCTLQDSSLATEACVWLGDQETTRSHLTQDMVRDLLPALTRFAATGSIAIAQE